MTRNQEKRSPSITSIGVGIAIGALISILFVATGHPGLIGVGAAIGAGFGQALNECYGNRGR